MNHPSVRAGLACVTLTTLIGSPGAMRSSATRRTDTKSGADVLEYPREFFIRPSGGSNCVRELPSASGRHAMNLWTIRTGRWSAS